MIQIMTFGHNMGFENLAIFSQKFEVYGFDWCGYMDKHKKSIKNDSGCQENDSHRK